MHCKFSKSGLICVPGTRGGWVRKVNCNKIYGEHWSISECKILEFCHNKTIAIAVFISQRIWTIYREVTRTIHLIWHLSNTSKST